MKSTLITMIIGVIIILIAFWYGGRRVTEEYKDNLKKEVITQEQNDVKVDKYSPDDMCSIVLHGKLSESGECE